MTPTAKSYFSGGGLIDIGLINAGINVVQSLEIDPVACETLFFITSPQSTMNRVLYQ